MKQGDKTISELLKKAVMPVFQKGKLFKFSEDYKKEFEKYLKEKYSYLKEKYPDQIKDNEIDNYLQPIVKNFYGARGNILSILKKEEAKNETNEGWEAILKNVNKIADHRAIILSRSSSQKKIDKENDSNSSPKHSNQKSGQNFNPHVAQKKDITNLEQTPMWSDALNYHFSFQGFMETVREFEMFANAYSEFLTQEKPKDTKEEIKIYKYTKDKKDNLKESKDVLEENEIKHLITNDCYCKDKDNIYFTANYVNRSLDDESSKKQEIKKFFKEEGCKVFKLSPNQVAEYTVALNEQEQKQLKTKGYYNSGGKILFNKLCLFNKNLYSKNGPNVHDDKIQQYFKAEDEAILKAADFASIHFSSNYELVESESQKINKAKLIELTTGYIKSFAERTISNYKFLCEKQIKNLLDAQIKEVVIPSGANKMGEILQFLGGAGVEELKRIDEDFNDQLNATQKLIDEEYQTLQDLYIGNEKNGVKFNQQVFNEAKQVFSTQITECFNELKADLSSAIKEKTLFIDQVKEQYVGALKEALGQKDNNDFTFLYQQYKNSLDKTSLDNNIYNKLPKWIQQGVDGFTTKLTIGDKEVGFILNKSQKTIINKLTEFANPNNPARSQTQSFYLGTGGGKTYLNDLISGKEGLTILGSDGIKYSAEDIKKAIFGDSGPHIISINFHQIKEPKDFQRHLEKFNDPSKKKILILDEYHLFPKEVRNNLKDILKDKNIFVIKSTATPTPEELYYKNLKREILGNGGTKKLSKDNYNEIQGKINLFLEYNEAQHKRLDKNENVANNNKKYHLIIDSTMISDGLVMNGKIENCNIDASITNEKPDIKIFGFKNKENQEQFFIEEKKGADAYKKVDCKVSDGYSRKNFSKSDLKEYLNKEENKEKKYQIYYPDSISAGGDFGIADGVGKTKISIVIYEDLLKKPATEIVNYILQALGRDRFFDFTQSNSFANVKFIGKDGSDKTDVIKRKFKEAQKFYNKKEGDANPLFDYLQNKFKSIDDKKYIALFYKIIKDNPQKTTLNLIESLKKSFDDPKDFKKFESRFVAASIIQQFEDCNHVFAKDIKETAKKITNSGHALQNQKIIEFFTKKLKEKGVFFEDEVLLTADIFLEDVGTQIVVNYKIKVTNSGDAMFSISSKEQGETVRNLLANCGIEVVKTKEFLYNQTLESLEVEKANAIPTVKYNASFKGFEYNSNFIDICVNSVSKINHKEGDKAISLEAKAILHLFNKFLESEDNQLIKDFFTNNPPENNPVENNQIRHRNKIFDSISSNNSSNQNNQQIILGKQQSNQALIEQQKLEIIKTALSQRNKYDKSGNKNTIKDRAGTSYEALKKTLQTLNEKNINFTTESLKLFNVDNKETLKNDKEKENLIKEKALFVRAMGSAKISNFKAIDTTNVPDKNILLSTGTKPSNLQTRLSSLKKERYNNQNQK